MNELEKLLNPDNRIIAQLLQEAELQPFKVLEISYSPGNIPARKGYTSIPNDRYMRCRAEILLFTTDCQMQQIQ